MALQHYETRGRASDSGWAKDKLDGKPVVGDDGVRRGASESLEAGAGLYSYGGDSIGWMDEPSSESAGWKEEAKGVDVIFRVFDGLHMLHTSLDARELNSSDDTVSVGKLAVMR